MTSDRIEELLVLAATDGELPADATPGERAEVESLMAGARRLRATAFAVDEEAAASLPSARARFERFVAAEQAPAHVVQRGASGWARGFRRRGLVLAGAAAGIGVLAAGAVFAVQAGLSTTNSADAEVLDANDYAQIQGVVTAIDRPGAVTTLEVQSAFGAVSVEVGAATSVTSSAAGSSASVIQRGDLVSVSGVANAAHTVAADAVAIETTGAAKPAAARISKLTRLSGQVGGSIVAFVVSPGGNEARVLLHGGGRYYIVPLEGSAVARLLERSTNALGTDVTINDGVTAGDGVFSLVVGGAQQQDQASPMGIRGVVLARHGNELDVAAARGTRYTVVVDAPTRIVLAKSGLERSDVRGGNGVVGRVVAVAGALDEASGRITARLIVVGGRYTGGSVQTPPTTTAR